MPRQLLFDISGVDLNRLTYDRQEIERINPQRGDMRMLDGIIHVDFPMGQMMAFKDVRSDEFWVAGHIPGRPLFPGVLMLECAAQLASFYFREELKEIGFVGFGGVDECRFRGQVFPGSRLMLLLQKISTRHGHLTAKIQGLVNSTIVFEAKVIGIEM
jgi:3-hydroxyacyl-[acyl-carrier-protein] dehydratase